MNRILALQGLASTAIHDLEAVAGSGESNHCSSETTACSTESFGCKLNPAAEMW